MKRVRRHRCILALDVKEGEWLRFLLIPGNKIVVTRRQGDPLLVNAKTGNVTELSPDKYHS